MSTVFDASAIEQHGWRQGAVLGANLAAKARELAPSGIVCTESEPAPTLSYDFLKIVRGPVEATASMPYT